jgi:hypothetical protein
MLSQEMRRYAEVLEDYNAWRHDPDNVSVPMPHPLEITEAIEVAVEALQVMAIMHGEPLNGNN